MGFVLIDPCIPSHHLVTHLLLCSNMLYIFISNVLLAKTNVTRGLNDLQFIEEFKLDAAEAERDRGKLGEIEVSWWRPMEIGGNWWQQDGGSWWRTREIGEIGCGGGRERWS